MKTNLRHRIVQSLLLASNTVVTKSASANAAEQVALQGALPDPNHTPLEKISCVLATAEMVGQPA